METRKQCYRWPVLNNFFYSLSFFWIAISPSQAQTIENTCDVLAAAPADKDRIGPGVPLGEIDTGAAIAACETAVGEFPSTPRFRFQLGRALGKAGRDSEAASQYELAASAGYAPAAHNLAVLYLNDKSPLSNPDRGMQLLRFAADAGFSLSQYQLGLFFVNGQHIQRDLGLAVEWFSKAAEQGDPSAQNDLGYMYRDGIGVPRNVVLAIEFLRKSAAQGNSQAGYNLGVIYDNGIGVEIDASEAAKWYAASASKGNRAAQNDLAVLYQNGRGVEKEPSKALELYRASADKGFLLAEVNLGKTYEFGLGVPADYGQAASWYGRAAGHGNAWAQNELGSMYQNGRGVPQDFSKAMELYRMAADSGYSPAQANVGVMYANGYGVQQDLGEAAKWYTVAANNGNAWAQIELGLMYQNGRGVSQDHAKALELYRKAAGQGNAVAQANAGFMYARGYGVQQDFAEAAKWYTTASDNGNAWAENELGLMYQNGRGVAQDYGKAIELYRKAAAQGDTAAQANVGFMYANGWGVDRNYAEAAKWYETAASQGNASAQQKLGGLYKAGMGVDRDYAKAIAYFRQSAEQGNSSAQIDVGLMYEYGFGVAQDYLEAARWYGMAAEKGEAWGQNNLGILYLNGRGVERDYVRALELFTKAAAQNNNGAHANLGFMYANGYGVVKNFSDAHRQYLLAAGDENGYAMAQLAWLTERGEGVSSDEVKAYVWYRRAIEAGYTDAALSLGQLISAGVSTSLEMNRTLQEQTTKMIGFMYSKPRVFLGFKWPSSIDSSLRRAIAAGRRAARSRSDNHDNTIPLANRYAVAYAIGQDEVLSTRPAFARRALMWSKDQALAEAAYWLETAIRAGSGDAVLSLANLYLGEDSTVPWHQFRSSYASGLLSELDFFGDLPPLVGSASKAADLYEKAIATHGSNAARINLAMLLELGHGRAQNLDKAASLYHEAVGTRFDGQAQLGLLRYSLQSLWYAERNKWRGMIDITETPPQLNDIVIKAKTNFLRFLITDPVGRRIFSGELRRGQQYLTPAGRDDLILWFDYTSGEDVEISLDNDVVSVPNDKSGFGIRLNRTLLANRVDYLIPTTFQHSLPERIPPESLADSRITIEALDNANVFVHGEKYLIGFPQSQSLNHSNVRVPNVRDLTLELRATDDKESKVAIHVDNDRTIELSAPPDCLLTVRLDAEMLKTAHLSDLPDSCTSWDSADQISPVVRNSEGDPFGYIRKLPNEKVEGLIAGFLKINRELAMFRFKIGWRWDESYRAAQIFYAQDLRNYGPNSFATIQSAITMADLEVQLGMATSARARLDNIFELLNRLGDVPLATSIEFFKAFGSTLAALGHYPEAERSFLHAVGLQEQQNSKEVRASWYRLDSVFSQLSEVAQTRGELDKAILYRLQAQFGSKLSEPERSDAFNAEIGPPIDLLSMLRDAGLDEPFSRLLPYLYREAKREIVRDVPEPLKFPLDLRASEATFGNVDHSERLAGALGNLGQIYSWMGRHSEALPLAQQLAKTRENIFGESHPRTSIALAMVADEYRYLGATQDAASIARKAVSSVQSFITARRTTQQALVAVVNALRPATFALLQSLYALAESDHVAETELAEEGFDIAQKAQASTAALALQAFENRLSSSDPDIREYVRNRQSLTEELSRLDTQLIATVSNNVNFRDASREEDLKLRIGQIESEIQSLAKRKPNALGQYEELGEVSTIPYARLKLLMGEQEALMTFVSSGDATFVFFATNRQLSWTKVSVGNHLIEEMVETLRCGLDQTRWELKEGDPYSSRCLKLTGVRDPPEPKFLLPFRLDVAYRLYQILFSPFEDQIKGKHIIVVPNGPIAALPLQVLVTEDPKAPFVDRLSEFEAVHWFGIRQPVSILPSVSSLNLLRGKAMTGSTAPEPFIGFANPLLVGSAGNDLRAFQSSASACSSGPAAVHGRSETVSSSSDIKTVGDGVSPEEVRRLAPLPETTREVCAVAESLGAPESALHIGDGATEAVVKEMSASGSLARARVVEFATHALLPGNNTSIESRLTEPALVLTPPSGAHTQSALDQDDGLLTASEIAQLQLDADWVVLSGCNTAGGDKIGDEALSGLARAFFFAGTRSLLVSHWEIDSQAAVKLTTRAFAEMRDHPEISRAEGLRRSIASVLASGGLSAHPSVWAPFVLIGD